MPEQIDGTTQALATASAEIFMLFDRADDAKIIARIRGEVLKECVYAFPQGGTMIYGLGIDGAEECKRELAKRGEVIREDDIDIISENPEEARFRAKASRWAVKPGLPDVKLDTTVELKRQEKFITLRNGRQAPNDFWLEQGGSKAMRNAILNLIPQTIKQQVIDAYKQQAKVVAHTPESADAATADYHRTMDAKDERDKKVSDLKEAWRSRGLMKSEVAKLLRAKGLSDVLADAHVSWMTVDEAVIDDLLAQAKAK